MIYSLIYISAVTQDFTEQLVHELLEISRKNNKIYGITGLLLLNTYQFLQYLEGDEKNVKQLMKNILNDSRHTNVIIIKEEKIKQRLFANWSMGYKNIRNLSKNQLKEIKHYDLNNIDHIPELFRYFIKQDF